MQGRCKWVAGLKLAYADNTNADMQTRAYWTVLAQKLGVPIRCVLFTASPKLAEHNDAVRALNDVAVSRTSTYIHSYGSGSCSLGHANNGSRKVPATKHGVYRAWDGSQKVLGSILRSRTLTRPSTFIHKKTVPAAAMSRRGNFEMWA